jgi:uroporphyrinogen-III decarboxylase
MMGDAFAPDEAPNVPCRALVPTRKGTQSAMNDRERILMILRGGQPDRVPWFGDLDYIAAAMELRGEVPADFRRSPAYFDLHRELGVGFYLQGYWPFQTLYDDTVVVREWCEGNNRCRAFDTPVGGLRERAVFLPESFTEARTEYLVKSTDDLKILRYLYEHTTYVPDYAEAKRRLGLVEDIGIVLCYTPKTPFMQLVALDAGIETVTTCVIEAADEFAQTLQIMEARLDDAVNIALASPADCLMIPENLSSEVVGKRFFEDYMRACQEKWVRRINEEGKSSFIHIDGTLRGLLTEEGAVGFSVLEALTPSPVGDVAMADMRGLAGPTSILWGGVPGIYFTPLVSDDEFERLVRDVLEVMRQEPTYVLGVADQVPPDGTLERVRRVVDLVASHGQYA